MDAGTKAHELHHNFAGKTQQQTKHTVANCVIINRLLCYTTTMKKYNIRSCSGTYIIYIYTYMPGGGCRATAGMYKKKKLEWQNAYSTESKRLNEVQLC